MGSYKIKQKNNGEFQFVLKAGNGQVILKSKRHYSIEACMNCIESIKINSQNEDNFIIKRSINDKNYFELKARNGQIIGKSEMYESISACKNGIASVMNNSSGELEE